MPVDKNKKSEQVQTCPSFFGSHSVMVDVEATKKLGSDNLISLKRKDGFGKEKDPVEIYTVEKFVICNDEFGSYKTERSKIDNGCADPNRYVTARLNKLFNIVDDKKNENE